MAFTRRASRLQERQCRPRGAPKATKPWLLTSSDLFRMRTLEADSHDYGDMPAFYAQQFDVDWARVAAKERFVAMVGRSDRALLARDSAELQRGAPPLQIACLVSVHLLRKVW